MTEQDKLNIIKTSWELHSLVESEYLSQKATKDDPEWLDKQRLLLADMALHLLQTALYPKPIKTDKLQNNLYAILTIADQFIPDKGLRKAAEKLF